VGAHDVEIATETRAEKERVGPDEVLRLTRGVERIISVKFGKVVEFDLKKHKPDRKTLLAHLLGPTGKLRAPTARKGRTLIVGFHPKTYDQILGTGRA
jgi:hypothetical protein